MARPAGRLENLRLEGGSLQHGLTGGWVQKFKASIYCVFSIVHWGLRSGDSVAIMLPPWHNLSMHTVENKPDMKP